MLDNLFGSGGATTLSVGTIIVNITLTFLLTFIIALVYRKTHKGLSYSQSFVFTLVLLGVLICVVMMVIGSSVARAFGALGAFSLIRFRTAVKDTKDTAFVFFAVAIGMAIGTNNYHIAIIGVIIISFIILILSRINFGSIRKYDYILTFMSDSDKVADGATKPIFSKYLKTSNLLNVSAKEHGKILEMTFNVKFFSEDDRDNLLKELNAIEGVSEVNLISAKNDIEY
ncbi:DUF4956 domain-containing protein [Patescibacteria group bacterium]|nr:DUF4956 domain-containing protein [Patescibacteria group bacterium]MBU4511795.1 DUF4956 domain-containing protein [Patescibacteria group bacterium]